MLSFDFDDVTVILWYANRGDPAAITPWSMHLTVDRHFCEAGRSMAVRNFTAHSVH
jgi:hypothetical protein